MIGLFSSPDFVRRYAQEVGCRRWQQRGGPVGHSPACFGQHAAQRAAQQQRETSARGSATAAPTPSPQPLQLQWSHDVGPAAAAVAWARQWLIDESHGGLETGRNAKQAGCREQTGSSTSH